MSNGCCEWVSLTPFVPPRFLKKNGSNSLEGQVNAELRSRGLPPAIDVEVLVDETKAFRHFVISRQQAGSAPPVPVCFALRLKFAEPVPGLISLGYASHFGMGLFVANT